jgi:hypothetical protein
VWEDRIDQAAGDSIVRSTRNGKMGRRIAVGTEQFMSYAKHNYMRRLMPALSHKSVFTRVPRDDGGLAI